MIPFSVSFTAGCGASSSPPAALSIGSGKLVLSEVAMMVYVSILLLLYKLNFDL